LGRAIRKLLEFFHKTGMLYIYNLIPHTGNKFLKPNKVFYTKTVELRHLKNFGCVYYFRDGTQHKSNFFFTNC